MDRKLYKSRSNKYILGVCGGVGEYLNVDPNIIRILVILLGFTFVGAIAYFVIGTILPEAPYN